MSSIQSSNGAQQTVCSRCEQFDERLASIIDEDKAIPATGLSLLSLGFRSQKTSCKMCRFLLNFTPNYDKDYKQHVRLFDRVEVSSLDEDFSALTALPQSRFLSVLRENKRLRYEYNVKDEIAQSGILVYSLASSSSPYICSVNPMTVDFKLLNSWIAYCQGSHALCTQVEGRNSLPYIYLIDCTERVVREDTGQDYLALSYVWASSSQAIPRLL